MRPMALAATLAGAAGSVGFLLYAGRGSPHLVMAIIAVWVLAPFAGLILADLMAKRWPAPLRQTLYVVMLAVTLCSVAAYGSDFLRPHTPRAAIFVLVPGLSWLFIAAVLSLTWLRSRGRPEP